MGWWIGMMCCCLLAGVAASAQEEVESLRLVPFPKHVERSGVGLRVGAGMTLRVSDSRLTRRAAEALRGDLKRAAGVDCAVTTLPDGGTPESWLAVLGPDSVRVEAAARRLGDLPAPREGYRLVVTRSFAAVGAREAGGLAHGLQTLRQLARANMNGRTLPGVEITDFPALGYRGFLDDLTRGPSPKLTTLQRDVDLAALLRMNFLTYYMESQFRFRKHPAIGPEDGSLTPEELRALVDYAKDTGVEIIGCQQSFGHFYNILRHPEYAALRETPDILNPMTEESYRLLDDLYSEQMPALDSPLFNVCCDETFGLGTGPSKPLADKIGVGGVYARHLRRLHDLLKERYGKRMMMWGDIISMHPDHLAEIPKDTIMLSWAYHAADSFEPALAPFVRAGYDFFVCPGVNNWSRILPDFTTAAVNIRNYVRDGAKLGAMGMLNTTWGDDGETLFAPNWHGLAWGAECAWTGSTTTIEEFNRRLGGVLFGEKGDHFGQAIALLGKTHALPGYGAMMDSRFWQPDFGRLPVTRESAQKQARALLALVNPALAHLRAARRESVANADLLDYFLFDAERARLMATRTLDFLRASDAYERAVAAGADSRRAEAAVEEAIRLLEGARAGHLRLRAEYIRLWNGEHKPYALDRVTVRYDAYAAQYDPLLANLRRAQEGLRQGAALPSAPEVGLATAEAGARRTVPRKTRDTVLSTDAAWAAPDCPQRVGITLETGDQAREDLPVELDLPAGLGALRQFRLMALADDGSQTPVVAQIMKVKDRSRLLFMTAGRLPAGARRAFLLYVSPKAPAAVEKTGDSVTVTNAPEGMKRIENGPLRLLLGPEGGHLYRWEAQALNDRDLTQPGEKDWAGFADLTGPYRNAPNRIEVLAAGPALARLRCTDPSGLQKTFDVWAGVPWVECRLSAPSDWFACYDDLALMGADSPTPGQYLFANGDTGPLHPLSTGPECQEKRDGQFWSAKYVPGGPLLALLTPEVTARHCVGPGGGMGAVFLDGGGPSVSHFVIVGGVCPADPAEWLNRLRATLDDALTPALDIYAAQRKP